MNNPTINQLQTLYKRNFDAESGYDTVAKEINNPSLKSMFESYSRQRHQFHKQIEKEISLLGGTINRATTVKADLHQSWIQIKSLFTNGSEEAILEEVVRGEEALINEYENVLSQDSLLPSTKELLQNQLDLVKKTKARMLKLETVYS